MIVTNCVKQNPSQWRIEWICFLAGVIFERFMVIVPLLSCWKVGSGINRWYGTLGMERL